MDLAENVKTEDIAGIKPVEAIMEYAEDFYNEFEYWRVAPNRKAHIPYVFKALIQTDVRKLAEQLKCRSGKKIMTAGLAGGLFCPYKGPLSATSQDVSKSSPAARISLSSPKELSYFPLEYLIP